jgi:hypothetical protein
MNDRHLNLSLVLILAFAVGLACNLSSDAPGSSGGERSSSAAAKDLKAQSGIEKVSAGKFDAGGGGFSSSELRAERLDGYTLRGVEFVYYKIPAGLSRDELIETAQRLHDAEPKAQLILVDDDSQVSDYVKYAKAKSGGQYDADFPKLWAEEHIVANVQKMLSGKWMLYESYGYREIAELK